MTERKEKMAHVKEYVPPKFVHYVGRRIAVKLDTGTETLVEQCHRENTDINKIIARYRRSGSLPEAPELTYGDTTNVGEYMDVVSKIREAKESFDNLPPQIKDTFNSPEEFMAYVENQEEKVKRDQGKKPDPKPAAKSEVPPTDKTAAPADGDADP